MKKNTKIRIATGMVAACLLCGNAFALDAAAGQDAEPAVTVTAQQEQHVAAKKIGYATANVNVRSKPSKDGSILGTLKKGTEVQTTGLKDGWYTISFAGKTGYISAAYTTTTKPGQSTEQEFSDVPKTAWYYDAVNWAVKKGITSGTTKTTFSPNQVCTRAQAVTFLWRNAGSPDVTQSVANKFSDVKSSDWYYKAVMWAISKNVTSGTTETTFSPNKTCSRAEIVTFMWKASGSNKVAYTNPFTDVKVADWYYEPVMWAVKNGITSGTSKTTFAPKDGCTRAQVVTFLYNAK